MNTIELRRTVASEKEYQATLVSSGDPAVYIEYHEDYDDTIHDILDSIDGIESTRCTDYDDGIFGCWVSVEGLSYTSFKCYMAQLNKIKRALAKHYTDATISIC